MDIRKFNLVLIIIFSIFIGSGYSGTLKGVKMEDTIKVENDTLVLNGMALRKKFFFKVYVAGLYLPKKETNEKSIFSDDTKRVLIMQFMRSVGAKKLNGAWLEGLEDNTPKHSVELKKQFDVLCSYMADVKESDKIEFTYIPNIGTKIIVKKMK